MAHLSLQLGDALARREQGQGDDFRFLFAEPQGLGIGEFPAHHCGDQLAYRLVLVSGGLHAQRHTRFVPSAQIKCDCIYPWALHSAEDLPCFERHKSRITRGYHSQQSFRQVHTTWTGCPSSKYVIPE